MSDAHLRRDGDRWLVEVDGEVIDEVYQERIHTDRYPYHRPSDRGRGSTRWVAGSINDEDFDTRREAVAELLHRHESHRRKTENER